MSNYPHPVDQHVGRRLRQRRSLVGMSQERLGELLGITFQQIQKYERGTNRIGSSRLFEIAQILAVPITYFFDGAEERSWHHPVDPTRAMAPGLAEVSRQYEPDGGKLTSNVEEIVVDSRETLELVRAFKRIGDPLVRRKLFELTKSLATLSYQTGRDGSGTT